MRNVVEIKRGKIPNKVGAIIISTTEGRRMKSFGSRSIMDINGSDLINNQIATLRKKYPSIDICCVFGFEAGKIYKSVSELRIRVVENDDYENMNASRNISSGLKVMPDIEGVIIIHGDIFFSENSLPTDMTSLIPTEDYGIILKNKVGGVITENKVVNLSYGLYPKWCQYFCCIGNELELLKKIVFNRENDKLCTFEVINKIIDSNGVFQNFVVPPNCIIKEINTTKDIEELKGRI